MPRLSFRKESRLDYGGEKPDETHSLNLDQLQTGCLMRIADAVEIIAKDKESLEQRLKSAKDSLEYWQDRANKYEKTVQVLKGHMTRLKKKILENDNPA